MNRILSLVRRCVEDYEMIAPGDRIAVGVSGGKDSLLTLAALAKLREFYPVPYELEAGAADRAYFIQINRNFPHYLPRYIGQHLPVYHQADAIVFFQREGKRNW